MTPMQLEALVASACEARKRAYAAYSKYGVGAAVRTTSGQVFQGCNVENVSFGLTMCAERVAVASAIVAGERDFEAIAVATRDGSTPCGACRQFLAEFALDIPVLIVTASKKPMVRRVRLSKLLPDRFPRKTVPKTEFGRG